MDAASRGTRAGKARALLWRSATVPFRAARACLRRARVASVRLRV